MKKKVISTILLTALCLTSTFGATPVWADEPVLAEADQAAAENEAGEEAEIGAEAAIEAGEEAEIGAEAAIEAGEEAEIGAEAAIEAEEEAEIVAEAAAEEVESAAEAVADENAEEAEMAAPAEAEAAVETEAAEEVFPVEAEESDLIYFEVDGGKCSSVYAYTDVPYTDARLVTEAENVDLYLYYWDENDDMISVSADPYLEFAEDGQFALDIPGFYRDHEVIMVSRYVLLSAGMENGEDYEEADLTIFLDEASYLISLSDHLSNLSSRMLIGESCSFETELCVYYCGGLDPEGNVYFHELSITAEDETEGDPVLKIESGGNRCTITAINEGSTVLHAVYTDVYGEEQDYTYPITVSSGRGRLSFTGPDGGNNVLCHGHMTAEAAAFYEWLTEDGLCEEQVDDFTLSVGEYDTEALSVSVGEDGKSLEITSLSDTNGNYPISVTANMTRTSGEEVSVECQYVVRVLNRYYVLEGVEYDPDLEVGSEVGINFSLTEIYLGENGENVRRKVTDPLIYEVIRTENAYAVRVKDDDDNDISGDIGFDEGDAGFILERVGSERATICIEVYRVNEGVGEERKVFLAEYSIQLNEVEISNRETYNEPWYMENMVPGQGFSNAMCVCGYVRNAEYPDGADLTFPITDLFVSSQSEEEVLSIEYNEDWYQVQAVSVGEAVLTITYTDYKGNERSFDQSISVVDGYLEVDCRFADDTDNMLRGGEKTVTARVNYYWAYDDGYACRELDDYTLELITADGEAAYDTDALEVTVDEDGRTLSITASETCEYGAYDIPLLAVAAMDEGTENERRLEKVFNVNVQIVDGYYYLDCDIPEKLAPGETVSVYPELYRVSEEDGSTCCSEAFRITYSSDDISVTDQGGAVVESDAFVYETDLPLCITKISSAGTGIEIIAAIDKGEETVDLQEVCRKNFRLHEIHYDSYFDGLREDNYTWVYTNEKTCFEVILDTEDTEDTLTYEWSVFDVNDEESGDYTEITAGYTADGSSLEIDGEAMMEAIGGEWNDLQVSVTIYNEYGYEVEENRFGLVLREPRYEYDYPWSDSITLLPEYMEFISGVFTVNIKDGNYPWGESFEAQILKLEIDAGDGSKEDSKVCKITGSEGAWEIWAMDYGIARISVEYEYNDIREFAEFEVCVCDEILNAEITFPNDRNVMLPGDDLKIMTGLCYEWYHSEYDCGNMSVEDYSVAIDDSIDPEVLEHLSFTISDTEIIVISDGEEGSYEIPVKFTCIVDEDTENAHEISKVGKCWVNVVDAFYAIEIFGMEETLLPGAYEVLEPRLCYYSLGEEGINAEILSSDVCYRIEYNEDHLEIRDEEDDLLHSCDLIEDASPSLQVSRMSADTIDFTIRAYLYDSQEDEYTEIDNRHLHMDAINCDIQLDGLREYDYTWIFPDESMTISPEIALPEELDTSDISWEWTLYRYDGWEFDPDDADELDEGYELAADGSITLDGETLSGLVDRESQRIMVCCSVLNLDIQLAEYSFELFLAENEENINYPWYSQGMVPDRDLWIDRYFGGYIQNKDHPYGEELEYQITKMTVSAVDDSCGEPCSILEEEDGWVIHTNGCGAFEIEAEYFAKGREPQKACFTIYVDEDILYVQDIYKNDCRNVLPGDMLVVFTKVIHEWNYGDGDEGSEEIEDYTLAIVEEDGEPCYETDLIQADTENQALIVVGIKQGQSGIYVTASATCNAGTDRERELTAYSLFQVTVSGDYYYMKLDNIDPLMSRGTTCAIEPEVRYVGFDIEGDRVDIPVDDLLYRITFSDDVLSFSTAEGSLTSGAVIDSLEGLTLTRVGRAGGYFNIAAGIAEESYENFMTFVERSWDVWELDEEITYTISFDGNGVYKEKTQLELHAGDAYEGLPVPSVKGYQFLGWYTDPKKGTQVTAESIFEGEEDQTLYAHWSYNKNVDGFVARLYSVCLGRNASAAEISGWAKQLSAGTKTGVQAAQGFIFSNEFKKKNLCNTDYVKYLYQAFMGRGADAAGLASWVKKLDAGMTREEVFNGFACSKEFGNICASYGITVGSKIKVPAAGTVPTGPCSVCGAEYKAPEQTDGVTAFVKRLYDVCFGRKADATGLNTWCTKLKNQSATGSDVAYGFFFSPEFTNKKYTDEEYVKRLYQAFFGRAADAAGLASWVKQLQGGKSRKAIFEGFVGSKEFANLCASYGIKAK